MSNVISFKDAVMKKWNLSQTPGTKEYAAETLRISKKIASQEDKEWAELEEFVKSLGKQKD